VESLEGELWYARTEVHIRSGPEACQDFVTLFPGRWRGKIIK
jgi:hypothetical protein